MIEILDKITIVFAFIIMLLTICGWGMTVCNHYKNKKLISVLLYNKETPETKVLLSQRVMRKHLSRAELKGCLSDCYRGANRSYDIPYLGDGKFSNSLRLAQQGKTDSVEIELSEPNSLIADFKTAPMDMPLSE
ncbi:hypothetical protein [Pelistega sp. MC2]|uniref:hypothetical protein n=1 Tax=Pelistega sp. MC2 TaxID=1720297 RepID=UPI0008DA1523|nr:hypothetical protein [Pelistega sp. MC2]